MFFRVIFLVLMFGSLTNPVFGAGSFHKVEKTDLYEIRIEVPKAIMSIDPLNKDVLKRFKSAADETKKSAEEGKKSGEAHFFGHSLETKWQVTFENADLISISGISDEYQGGAHPHTYFETIVWDKKAKRAIPLRALFNENQADLALKAISQAAQKSWIKIYSQRSGEAPSADLLKQAAEGISPAGESMKNYVLTHAKGQANANGIVLLYGAGDIWAHALGEFRIAVPLSVFHQYLKPDWRAIFKN
jgi:hypothetical protein